MTQRTVTYEFRGGTQIRIIEVDDLTGMIAFFDQCGQRTVPPKGITVVGDLGGPTRCVNGAYSLTLLDNYKIYLENQLILDLQNKWRITHSPHLVPL